jgi:hypothetical protein
VRPRLIDRRTLLRGSGVALALPLLDAMTARAATAPRRLITFYFPCGTHLPDWTPPGDGSLPATMSPCLEPLAPLRQHLVVVTGLAKAAAQHKPGGVDGAGHARGTGTFATGMPCTKFGAGGPSVDQVAAQALGASTRLRSLVVAADSARRGFVDGLSEAHMCNVSWTATNTPVPAERDPRRLFDRLFAGPSTPAAARRLAAERRSVLDVVNSDIHRLERQVGAADRARVDQHLTAVRELERQLDRPWEPLRCRVPSPPAAAKGQSSDERVRLLIDLQILALSCDLTRFGSFQLANAASEAPMPHLDINEGLHTVSHDTTDAGRDKFRRMVAHQMKQFAYLLDGLRRMPEGSGTLLDQTLVFCSSEVADGARHTYEDMPVVLAGHAGGLRGGRHLRYPKRSLNDLFVALLHLVGAPSGRFGDDGSGPLPIAG